MAVVCDAPQCAVAYRGSPGWGVGGNDERRAGAKVYTLNLTG